MWYHYFDAQEVFNSIRCYIDAYVWMTGFGKMKFDMYHFIGVSEVYTVYFKPLDLFPQQIKLYMCLGNASKRSNKC